MTEPAETFDYRIVNNSDNGEFLTRAVVALRENGKVIETTEFFGSSEFPGEDAVTQANSYGASWLEAVTFTLEERLGPFGIEWEREQEERRDWRC